MLYILLFIVTYTLFIKFVHVFTLIPMNLDKILETFQYVGPEMTKQILTVSPEVDSCDQSYYCTLRLWIRLLHTLLIHYEDNDDLGISKCTEWLVKYKFYAVVTHNCTLSRRLSARDWWLIISSFYLRMVVLNIISFLIDIKMIMCSMWIPEYYKRMKAINLIVCKQIFKERPLVTPAVKLNEWA